MKYVQIDIMESFRSNVDHRLESSRKLALDLRSKSLDFIKIRTLITSQKDAQDIIDLLTLIKPCFKP